MGITRRTLIGDLDDLSVRTHRRLVDTGYQTVGDLLDQGSNLHTILGRKAMVEFADVLPAKWRVRVLERPPHWRKPPADAPKVRRVRVHCTRCGRVSSVMAHRADEPCSHCRGKVERRSKGRPRKQPEAA